MIAPKVTALHLRTGKTVILHEGVPGVSSGDIVTTVLSGGDPDSEATVIYEAGDTAAEPTVILSGGSV